MDDKIDYSSLTGVRDYIQDVSKLVGKFQQAVIAFQPNDWHKGLLVDDNGVVSQELIINGQKLQLKIDLVTGFLVLGDEKWSLTKYSPQRLMQELLSWDARHGIRLQIDKPVFVTAKPNYNSTSGQIITDSLKFASGQLNQLKSHLSTGSISPILLYPHHFDLALSWYLQEVQYTIGFSLGDENINEPYFYVTEFPESPQFKLLKISSPGYWQENGFSGAVLNYQDLGLSGDRDNILQNFFMSVLETKLTK